MKITIRKLQPEDALFTAKLHELAFSQIGETAEDFLEGIKRSEIKTWVAVYKNNILGYIQAKPKGAELFCTWFAVGKKMQGLGVGSSLVKKLRSHGKKMQFKAIRLETRNRFKKAICFYLNHDYQIKSTRIGKDGDTMIEMVCSLKR